MYLQLDTGLVPSLRCLCQLFIHVSSFLALLLSPACPMILFKLPGLYFSTCIYWHNHKMWGYQLIKKTEGRRIVAIHFLSYKYVPCTIFHNFMRHLVWDWHQGVLLRAFHFHKTWRIINVDQTTVNLTITFLTATMSWRNSRSHDVVCKRTKQSLHYCK